MNITINTGAATDDAAQIKSIVDNMEADMETLNAAFKRNIPDGIQTTWSGEVKANWDNYCAEDIPAAMAGMKTAATNLELAVQQALAYDREQ